MPARPRETIFALASAPGRAGIAMVRISGPLAKSSVESLTRRAAPEARRASLRRVFDGAGNLIDEGLVVVFDEGSSFTGEDVAEFSLHGGRAILEAVFAELVKLGLRPAEPGEFTRRAVENGRLDLTRAEAIADLVAAETEAQRRQAVGQYEGQLADLYDGWRSRLIGACALAEAAIDFADEELPEDLLLRAQQQAKEITQEIQSHMADGRRGEILREGLRLTVIGPPNAGKSSLINSLAQRDVAIVSEIAGTTRDVIEVHLDLGGYAVIASDTAGLRESGDVVETEGVRRALASAGAADIVLLLLDGSSNEPMAGVSDGTNAGVSLTVWNKRDLLWPQERDGLVISLVSGAGVEALIRQLTKLVESCFEARSSGPALTRVRYRVALAEAVEALGRAAEAEVAELCAEDLRLAARAIGRITGRVDVEDLLDVIFREFCIGK